MTPLIGNVPLTLKSRLTIAFVIVDEVLTGSVVETRFGQTLIILRAAVAPRVAGLAPALVAARFVAADAEVTHILLRRQVQPVAFPALPSLGAALVNVRVAVETRPSLGAGALIPPRQVGALAPGTGTGRALVNVLAAPLPSEAERTGAGEGVDAVKALLEGLTVRRHAIVDVVLAPSSIEA